MGDWAAIALTALVAFVMSFIFYLMSDRVRALGISPL